MKNEKLLEVISHNLKIQKQARELNIRAGQEVFHVMTRSEIESWLKDRLHEARRASEIIEFNEILFPELDKELVEKVITDNPDSVTIEGTILSIQYGNDYGSTYYDRSYIRTSVNEEFARSASVDSVVLPGGRVVLMRCSGHFANTFVELVEKLEKSRIESCWAEARCQNETSWTTDFDKVIELLVRVGDEVEVTRTDNGRGELVVGFVGLKRYSSGYKEVSLFLADSKEKVQEETQRALENLLQMFVKNEFAIPQEEPWQVKGTGWYSSWSMTDLGNALQARYESLVKEYAQNLTAENIVEEINTLKLEIQKAKAEVGGSYESVKRIIEETESSIESQISGLDDRGFVESEIREIHSLLNKAKEQLKSGEYTQVQESCEEVKKVWKQAQGRITTRKEKIDKGEVLVNFEAWHRRGGMSNNGDGWVISSDGSFRKEDNNDVPRHKSDGVYHWNFISEEELALRWSCGTCGDITGSSSFEVVKMPVSGITDAQLQAVKRIELEDLGAVENSFSLDSLMNQQQESFMSEVEVVFPVCPVCNHKIDYEPGSYLKIIGNYGMCICQDSGIRRLVKHNQPETHTEGRSAWVVSSQEISTGVIEVLAYDKFGCWNLNLRFREFTEEEIIERSQTPENSTQVVDVSTIDLGELFGGGVNIK